MDYSISRTCIIRKKNIFQWEGGHLSPVGRGRHGGDAQAGLEVRVHVRAVHPPPVQGPGLTPPPAAGSALVPHNRIGRACQSHTIALCEERERSRRLSTRSSSWTLKSQKYYTLLSLEYLASPKSVCCWFVCLFIVCQMFICQCPPTRCFSKRCLVYSPPIYCIISRCMWFFILDCKFD